MIPIAYNVISCVCVCIRKRERGKRREVGTNRDRNRRENIPAIDVLFIRLWVKGQIV